MVVPAAVEQLDEAHAAFGKPPREQAVGRKGAGLPGIRTVQLEDPLRLFREIRQLGHRALHPVRHLVLRDARRDLRIARLLELHLVQLCQMIQVPPPRFAAESRRVREIQHRIANRSELHALVLAGQKSAAPQPIVKRLIAGPSGALRHHHHKGRKIVVLASEPVRNPRPDARPPGQLRSGLEERDAGIVIDGFGVHRLDEAQVVDDLCRVRQQLADPRTGLSVLRELEHRRRHRKGRLRRGHAGQTLPHPDRGRQLRAAQIVQPRLVVEHVHLRRPARLKQIDHALGRGREMRQVRADACAAPASARAQVFAQQRRQRCRADAPARQPENCRRVSRIWCSSRGSMRHSFVIVSSKFRIRLASVAYAASSLTSSSSSRGESPWLKYFRAASGSCL